MATDILWLPADAIRHRATATPGINVGSLLPAATRRLRDGSRPDDGGFPKMVDVAMPEFWLVGEHFRSTVAWSMLAPSAPGKLLTVIPYRLANAYENGSLCWGSAGNPATPRAAWNMWVSSGMNRDLWSFRRTHARHCTSQARDHICRPGACRCARAHACPSDHRHAHETNAAACEKRQCQRAEGRARHGPDGHVPEAEVVVEHAVSYDADGAAYGCLTSCACCRGGCRCHTRHNCPCRYAKCACPAPAVCACVAGTCRCERICACDFGAAWEKHLATYNPKGPGSEYPAPEEKWPRPLRKRLPAVSAGGIRAKGGRHGPEALLVLEGTHAAAAPEAWRFVSPNGARLALCWGRRESGGTWRAWREYGGERVDVGNLAPLPVPPVPARARASFAVGAHVQLRGEDDRVRREDDPPDSDYDEREDETMTVESYRGGGWYRLMRADGTVDFDWVWHTGSLELAPNEDDAGVPDEDDAGAAEGDEDVAF